MLYQDLFVSESSVGARAVRLDLEVKFACVFCFFLELCLDAQEKEGVIFR